MLNGFTSTRIVFYILAHIFTPPLHMDIGASHQNTPSSMCDKAVMGKINAEKARKYGIFQQVTGIKKAVQSVSQGNKTPPCARLISPGFGITPPPISAALVTV